MRTFSVKVARVGEGEHQAAEEDFDDVVSLRMEEDGSLTIRQREGRSASLSGSSWGAFKVVRVASAANRN